MQMEERRRIAEDLHDSTAQHLTAAELALGMIEASRGGDEAPAIAIALGDARHSIREAKKEIRLLSYLLHPPGVSGTRLSEAVRTFVLGFGARAGLETDVRIPPQRNEVTDEIAVACFRVCQEALANVHRHARATGIVVALDVSETAVTLEVADNGRGLGLPGADFGASMGVGIPAMRERMERLGGSVRLERAAQGTKVIATVPTSPLHPGREAGIGRSAERIPG